MSVACLAIWMAFSLACTRDSALEVDQIDPEHQGPDLQVATSSNDCSQVTVSISSTNEVVATFASGSGCDYGRAIIAGGAPTYTSTGRSLTVPVRVVNRSSSTVVAPVFVALPKDSGTVTVPSGGGTVSPSNADSTVAKNKPEAGKALWRILTAGSLAPGDTSAVKALSFTLPSRAEAVRLGLLVYATVPDTARPETPITTTWPKTNMLTAVSTLNPSVTYYRNVLGIRFKPAVGGAQVRQVLEQLGATIIGGAAHGTPLEQYIVTVPDPGPGFADVQALEQQIEARSEVEFVRTIPSEGVIEVRGRYPIDNAMAATRGSWFGSGSAKGTRPWIEIRAPLAWGCETGMYDLTSPPVKIGVLDSYFNAVHADIAVNVKAGAVFLPDTSEVGPPSNPLFYPEARGHGNAVAGIIAARGDNGIHLAGMVWRADLELYALGRGTDINKDASLVVKQLKRAGERGVRVLNLSIGAGDIMNTDEVALMRTGMKSYLASDANRLLVLAAGNRGIPLSKQDLANSTDRRLQATDRAAAQLLDSFPGRIIFVAATDPAGRALPESNIWTDVGMVAAPGDSMVTLSESGNLYDARGLTSVAAPFVAGSAAQIWSMAPGLTALQVAEYIRQGAAMPLRDSTTGQLITPKPNIGTPGIYRLDAYNSLVLVSRGVPGAPLCGATVRGSDAAITIQHSDTLSDTTHIDIPGVAKGWGRYASRVSVAQGGRLIATFVYYDPTVNNPATVVLDRFGNRVQTISGLDARVFTERDTVDIRTIFGPGPTNYSLQIRGPVPRSVPQLLNATGQPAFPPDRGVGIMPSPGGELVAYPCADGAGIGYCVLNLANQTVAVVGNGGTAYTRTAWRPDGSQLTFVSYLSTVSTLMAPVDVRYGGSGITFTPKPDFTLPGFAGWGELPAYTADGMVLRIFGRDGATSGCTFLDRLASDLSRQVGTPSTAPGCPFGYTMSPLVGRRN